MAANFKISSVLLFLFSFFSFFSFFSCSFFGHHEIIPFYLIFAVAAYFFCNKSNLNWRKFSLIILLSFGLMFFYFFIPLEIFLDFVSLLVVAVTLFLFSSFDSSSKRKVAYTLYCLSIAVVIYMALQKIFPGMQDFHYYYFTSRDATAEELQAYTGGVTGIAPEPAYMASWLIGSWILVLYILPELAYWMSLVTFVGITLSASLSGGIIYLVFFLISWSTTYRRLLSILLICIFAGVAVYFFGGNLMSRGMEFIDVISSSTMGLSTLGDIDSHFGSRRLATLISPLSNLGCGLLFCNGEYTRGYSIFAEIYYLLAPLHLIALLLLIRVKRRANLISLLAFIFYGPVLNWMMLVGLLSYVDARAKH